MSRLGVGVLFPPAGGIDDPLLDRLRDLSSDIDIVAVPYLEDQALRAARESGQVTEELLASAPQLTAEQRDSLRSVEAVLVMDLPDLLRENGVALRWVQVAAAGVGSLRPAELAARGVVLTNAAGVAAVSISEFVMGRILEVWKRIRTIEQDQRNHEWNMRFGTRAAGKTLGIIGLGAIGRAVAQRASAFEMTVIATRRSATPGDVDPDVDQLMPASEIDQVLAASDVVVVSAPSTPETENLFDGARLGAMKPGAILCNVARGSLVDEAALVSALESGHLSAAIIDVTRHEPLPPHSPLWDAPNMYLSPHASTSLDGYSEAIIELFADNLARYVTGQPLHNVVDPVAGY